jgi:hypothetical protein
MECGSAAYLRLMTAPATMGKWSYCGNQGPQFQSARTRIVGASLAPGSTCDFDGSHEGRLSCAPERLNSFEGT